MTTLPVPDTATDEDSGPITAEGLLRRRATQKPATIALTDPPNRRMLGLTPPRSYAYGEADAAVDALAAFFIDLGLEPGDRIVVQLPNFIESPLTLLGAWRAGLTVAAVPMLWRAMESARVCDALKPKALIGVSHLAEETPAEVLRDVAATRLSVRFVLGFGHDPPDGVAFLDDVVATGCLSGDKTEARAPSGPALITFTARAGQPLLPLFRHEDEILAQGAMAALALLLDRSDVILNAYPFTGPVGFALGLAPWLISGATLVQHHPFDYDIFVQQILTSNATVTALPSAILAELGEDRVLRDPQCKLRRVGRVWSPAELADRRAPLRHMTAERKLEPSRVRSLSARRPRQSIAAARACDGPRRTAAWARASRRRWRRRRVRRDASRRRWPGAPDPWASGAGRQGERAAARDENGFVPTGLRGETISPDRLGVLRDPELIYHGGFTMAASELDGLYQAFPGFLDAACFVLPDPIVGDCIFGAVAPSPNAPISLEALHRFLMERGVALYKFPDKLLVVKDIPRDRQGRILREEILRQVQAASFTAPAILAKRFRRSRVPASRSSGVGQLA
jgi:mycobactin salicyl-AMP ligase